MSNLHYPTPATRGEVYLAGIDGSVQGGRALSQSSASVDPYSEGSYDRAGSSLSGSKSNEAIICTPVEFRSEQHIGSEALESSDWEMPELEKPGSFTGTAYPENTSTSNVACSHAQVPQEVIETAKKMTMSYNSETYLSQIDNYAKMLAALCTAGCDAIRCDITRGIQTIVDRHSRLFEAANVGYLTGDTLKLNRKKEFLENENRDLRQDNNSLKALRELEAERCNESHQKAVSNMLEAERQLSEKAVELEDTKAEAMRLSHELSVLRSEKHEVKRSLAEKMKGGCLATTQLQELNAQVVDIGNKMWRLEDQIFMFREEAQRGAKICEIVKDIQLESTFLKTFMVRQGFCDPGIAGSKEEMKNWLATNSVFNGTMNGREALHSIRYRNAMQDVGNRCGID